MAEPIRVQRAEQASTVLVRYDRPGRLSWDVAAASEVVNEAIQQAIISIREDYPERGGTFPLEVVVTVYTTESYEHE